MNIFFVKMAQVNSFLKKTTSIFFVVSAIVVAGCNKSEPSKVEADLNKIAIEVTSQDDIETKLGFSNLNKAEKPSAETLTVSGYQFSDESLIVNLSANVDADVNYIHALWYQLSGPEAIIITPRNLQTQIALPAVSIEENLTFRFVIVTGNDEVYYRDTSVLVLPNESEIKAQPSKINEVESTQVFKIITSKALVEDLILNYSTHPLTADEHDYTPSTGSVLLPAGETEINIEIPINNDLTSEGNEYYYVSISSLDGAYSTKAIGVIVDNELPIDQGTSYAKPTDFGMDLNDNSLIAVNCSSSDFQPNLLLQCDGESACDSSVALFTFSGEENQKVISWDESLPKGNYRFSIVNESEALNECQITVLWNNVARDYSANVVAGESLYLDFFYGDSGLEVDQPLGLTPVLLDTPFAISLINATSGSLELGWPEIAGAAVKLYVGTAAERSFYSEISVNSVLIDSLIPGENYCFHGELTGVPSVEGVVSDVFCTQVPVEIMGALEFQLSWTFDASDGGPDLDLHVVDPDGVNWSYSNAIGHINPNLDIDDTGSGNGGPERMYWETPLSGTYKYRIDWFSTHQSALTYADYTLRVYADSILIDEKLGRLAVGADSDEFTFDYSLF